MKNSKVLSLLLCYGFEREFKKFSDKFVIEYNNDKTLFIVDGNLIMGIDNIRNCLYIRYYYFWKIFKTKFNLNDYRTRDLIVELMPKEFYSKLIKCGVNIDHTTNMITYFNYNEKI